MLDGRNLVAVRSTPGVLHQLVMRLERAGAQVKWIRREEG